MATSTQTSNTTQRRTDPGSQSGPGSPATSGTGVGRGIFFLVVIVGVLGVAAYGSTRLMGGLGESEATTMLTHEVAKGELLVTVTEDGNVESAVNTDIKCQVAGGSSILWIVPDGETVKKGDKLVELDQSALDEQINAQKIAHERARSTVIQAEKDYQVAQISVDEYLQGTFKIEHQTADSQITIAEENLRTSQNALDHSERMFRRGYISNLELEGQQFSVERAKLDLASANTAKEVLEKFTKVKMLEDLKSQVETARAHMESEKAAFSLEESKLKRLQQQMEHCVVYAPQAGMVVYANKSSGRFGSSQIQIEEGASVRERQSLLKLPDLGQMQVKVNVHETKVENLARNMRARIKIQDLDLQGTVVYIANQPEASSRWMGNVKEYATTVRIENKEAELKPGLTAEVEILVAHLKDVVTVPVAAVVEQRGKFFCWVKTDSGTERRDLVLGLSDDQFVEVKDGVAEGELVLLNPRAVVSEARGGDEGPEDVNVNEKFGATKSSDEGGQEAEAGGRGRSEGRGPEAGRGGEGGGRGAKGRGRGGEGGRGGGEGKRGGGGRRGGFNLMQYDSDGDGKISKSEAPEQMQTFFDRMDPNKDGFIDAAEIQAMRSGRGGRGDGGGRGGRGGGEGGGSPE